MFWYWKRRGVADVTVCCLGVRTIACGVGIYTTIELDRSDNEKQQIQSIPSRFRSLIH